MPSHLSSLFTPLPPVNCLFHTCSLPSPLHRSALPIPHYLPVTSSPPPTHLSSLHSYFPSYFYLPSSHLSHINEPPFGCCKVPRTVLPSVRCVGQVYCVGHLQPALPPYLWEEKGKLMSEVDMHEDTNTYISSRTRQ